MYEQQIILGHLGRDPEQRYTPSGRLVCNFPVATSRRILLTDGEVKELTVWYKVITWGKLAESCFKYLKKGRAVLVSGIPEVDNKTGRVRVWTDKDGNSRANLSVIASTVKFIGRGVDAKDPENDDGIEELESAEGFDTSLGELEAPCEDIPF